MAQVDSQPSIIEAGTSGDEISLIEIGTSLGEEKGFIALVVSLATAIGLAAALLAPPTFTAKTVLLPPQQGQGGSSAMLASLGALAATAGVGGGLRASEELYIGLLKSDSVGLKLADRFELRSRYGVESVHDVLNTLAARVRVVADRKSSLITLEVDDKDPVFAAQLANSYVDELRTVMTRIAVTEAQQRRLYFEQQMHKSKIDLVNAEIAFKQAQDRSGVISLDAQTQSAIATAAQLRSQIIAKEVQLRAARPYAGPENPEMKRLVSEIAGLRSELEQLEGGDSDSAAGAKDSKQGLANTRLFRELKYQEAMYSAMMQQLQLARADEAREAPLVQQLDIAIPPERKSKPRRSLIVIAAMVVGLLAGIAGAMLRRAVRRTKSDPAAAERWHLLVRAWSLRKI